MLNLFVDYDFGFDIDATIQKWIEAAKNKSAIGVFFFSFVWPN